MNMASPSDESRTRLDKLQVSLLRYFDTLISMQFCVTVILIRITLIMPQVELIVSEICDIHHLFYFFPNQREITLSF